MTNVFSMNDIRGRADDSLTTEYVWNVGKAFVEWLSEEGDVIVAKAQEAHQATAHAFIEGALLQGRNVIDTTAADQQQFIDAISEHQAAGGVFIKHDALQNLEIIEFFDGRGTPITADNGLMEINELVDAGNFVPATTKGNLNTL